MKNHEKNKIPNKKGRNVHDITDLLGKGIDEGIKPLVQAIWDAGYDTSQSCEGHSDWGRKYPFVDFDEATNDLGSLQKVIDEYNSIQVQEKKYVKWQLKRSHWNQFIECDVYELTPVEGVSLKDAKGDIEQFAKFFSSGRYIELKD